MTPAERLHSDRGHPTHTRAIRERLAIDEWGEECAHSTGPRCLLCAARALSISGYDPSASPSSLLFDELRLRIASLL